jgi:hypothetical protein
MNSKNIKIFFENIFELNCSFEETTKADGDDLINVLIKNLNEWKNKRGYLDSTGSEVEITRSNVEDMFRIRIDETWEKNFLSLKNFGELKNENKQHEVEIILLTDVRIFFDPSLTMLSGKNNASDYIYFGNGTAVHWYAVIKWNGDPPKPAQVNLNSETKFINVEVITLTASSYSSLAIEQLNKLIFENKQYVYPSKCSTELNPSQITVQTKTNKTTVRTCAFSECFPASSFDPKNPLHLLTMTKKDCVFTNPIDVMHEQLEKANKNLVEIKRKLQLCQEYLDKQSTHSENQLIFELDLAASMVEMDNCLESCIKAEQSKLKKREYTEFNRIRAYSKADKEQLYLAKLQCFQVPKPTFESKKGGYVKISATTLTSLGYFEFDKDIN